MNKKRNKDFNPDLLRDLHAEPLLRSVPAHEALALEEMEIPGSQSLAPLTKHETHRFDECEEIINKGITTFIDVGQALAEIRNRKLYRSEHRTFEAYCHSRWHLKRQRAYEIMGASEVAGNLSEISDISFMKESHAASLQKLNAEDQRSAWSELLIDSQGGKITASRVRKKVEEKLTKAYSAIEAEEQANKEQADQMRKEITRAISKSAEMLTVRISGSWLIKHNLDHVWRELRSVNQIIDGNYADEMTLDQLIDLGLLKINKSK